MPVQSVLKTLPPPEVVEAERIVDGPDDGPNFDAIEFDGGDAVAVEAFVWCSGRGSFADFDEVLDQFERSYVGCYDSLDEYADMLAEEGGWFEKGVPAEAIDPGGYVDSLLRGGVLFGVQVSWGGYWRVYLFRGAVSGSGRG